MGLPPTPNLGSCWSKALRGAPPGRCPFIPVLAHPWARMPARSPSPAAIPQPFPACSRSGQESTWTSMPGFISVRLRLASGTESSGRGSAGEMLFHNTLPPICSDPEPQPQTTSPPLLRGGPSSAPCWPPCPPSSPQTLCAAGGPCPTPSLHPAHACQSLGAPRAPWAGWLQGLRRP